MVTIKNKGLGKEIPPDLFHVEVYFLANGSSTEMAHHFFNYYKDNKWRNNRNIVIKNWKVLAWQWIYHK
ncbi:MULTISPECIES: hypothetical protein [Sphingobacterium]|uniref:hypothetical protein n=1 Tax=Sphingobacterium TaxID=28453 RepID=UPI0028ADB1B2|nr:hypothetical protein [Sphingobacterium multivorum]